MAAQVYRRPVALFIRSAMMNVSMQNRVGQTQGKAIQLEDLQTKL